MAAGDAHAADALLRAGDLAGARRLLAEELRARPDDVRARQFFWQLVAISGDWAKADAQLKTLAGVQASTMMLANVYGQAVAAEQLRQRVFSGEMAPKSLVGTEPWVEGLLDALAATTRGEADADARREAAFAESPASSGTFDGAPFEWIADADARFGPMLEVIIGADYGFIPFAAIVSLKADPVADLRDTVWRPVDIGLRSGESSMAFVPARYPGTTASTDTDLLLGRRTDWATVGDIEIGLGQRLLATDTDDHGLLEPFDIRLT